MSLLDHCSLPHSFGDWVWEGFFIAHVHFSFWDLSSIITFFQSSLNQDTCSSTTKKCNWCHVWCTFVEKEKPSVLCSVLIFCCHWGFESPWLLCFALRDQASDWQFYSCLENAGCQCRPFFLLLPWQLTLHDQKSAVSHTLSQRGCYSFVTSQWKGSLSTQLLTKFPQA